MIINIPSAQSLNDVALRLHFSGWGSLIAMRLDFDEAFPPASDPFPSGVSWGQEWAEYIAACQPELHSVCTLIQQSNELALKAKICSVSPFLLLLGNERRLSVTKKDINFLEFRTLDALELPKAVNTFCDDTLSNTFIASYNEIRSLRIRSHT